MTQSNTSELNHNIAMLL